MEVPEMEKSPGGTLPHSRILAAIHNLAYAGVYGYGRYRDKKENDADGHFEQYSTCLLDKED